MLSKSAYLILGLVQKESLNPYEIIKQLEVFQIKNWYPIANSTVYATIKTLRKQELVKEYSVKDSNAPERTVYEITEKGKIELQKKVKECIENISYDTVWFSIALLFLGIFDYKDIVLMCNERKKLLLKYRNGLSNQIEKLRSRGVKQIEILSVLHNLKIIEAELSIVEEIERGCYNATT